MNFTRTSFRPVLLPALVGLPLLAIMACEPVKSLAVENPEFAPDARNSDHETPYYGVHFITITTTDSSLATGEQTQATGIPRSYEGDPIDGPSISWSISPTEVATISSTGLITAGTTSGTATVYATSENQTRNMTITVDAVSADVKPSRPVHMVSITASTKTVKVGEVAQLSGIVRDDQGVPIDGVPIRWTSSPTDVATTTTTSSSEGTFTGRSAGQATIYATADTATRQITVTVEGSAEAPSDPAPSEPAPSEPAPSEPAPSGPTGASYGNATAAELPRASVSTSYPSMSRQVRVPAGGNLQGALDNAQPGDEMLLEPGATYVGNFQLLNKGRNNSWIVIRTDLSDAQLGAPGTRMTPTRAASARLAKILTPNISAAVETMLGANHYRLTGVEIGATGQVGATSTRSCGSAPTSGSRTPRRRSRAT